MRISKVILEVMFLAILTVGVVYCIQGNYSWYNISYVAIGLVGLVSFNVLGYLEKKNANKTKV